LFFYFHNNFETQAIEQKPTFKKTFSTQNPDSYSLSGFFIFYAKKHIIYDINNLDVNVIINKFASLILKINVLFKVKNHKNSLQMRGLAYRTHTEKINVK